MAGRLHKKCKFYSWKFNKRLLLNNIFLYILNMEEILKELIQVTLEKGPQNKQIYSNLCITKPIHDHAEILQRLEDAIAYLKSSFKSGKGYQSKLYTSRNCAIESSRVCSSFNVPENTGEVLTTVLALDLLFNCVDNEQFIVPSFQELISNFSIDILDELQDFIVPSCGISTFNLFKQVQQQQTTPTPTPPTSPDLNEQLYRDREEFDSGNDSPTSLLVREDSETLTIVDNFPDDINTSMITLYVLLHQGILQSKPVESVLQWIISDVFSCEEEEEEQEVEIETPRLAWQELGSSLSSASFTFPTFITKEQGRIDAVSVANVLNLMYHLDISHELLLNAAEEFLVTTLKDTITTLTVVNPAENIITSTSSNSPALFTGTTLQKVAFNSLGNTLNAISSAEDNEQKHSNDEEDEAQQKKRQPAHILQHHSPDSLLYFLSRALAISSSTNYTSNSSCRRPYIRQMKSLLLNLLDARLGTTMNTCDLAMRILAGVYLGVVDVANNTTNLNRTIRENQQNERYCSSSAFSSTSSSSAAASRGGPPCSATQSLRINNLLQKEFELLVSLQNDVDGSWPADSIVQVGFNERKKNDDFVIAHSSNDDNNGEFNNQNDIESEDQNDYLSNGSGTMNLIEGDCDEEIVAYLGGKELATLFAVKAIFVFLSCKKGSFVSDEGNCWGQRDNANDFGVDAEIHHLY